MFRQPDGKYYDYAVACVGCREMMTIISGDPDRSDFSKYLTAHFQEDHQICRILMTDWKELDIITGEVLA